MRPSKKELLDRMLKRVPNPQQLAYAIEPQEQGEILSAWVEVGLTRHPLECFRFTIYDMIRS